MPTANALAVLSQHTAKLVAATGSAEFPERVMAMLKELVAFNDGTIIIYPTEGLPVIDYFEVPKTGGSSSLPLFVKGPFLLDPYYLAAMRDRRFGLFQLNELAPTGFRDGEYYKSWYRNCGYKDECGYLLPLGDEGCINIALGKTTARARFSKKETALLQDILPLLQALCLQHWDPGEASSDGASLRTQMHSALDGFGSSLLTDRETQVINLVLHGHSTKTVAEKLNISMETVKLHRKHAYAKLEVGSQAELFYLFLDSLMSATDYSGGDTLIEYMQPPATTKKS